MEEIYDLRTEHIRFMLPLNNAHAAETSLLDEQGLESLLRNAFYARGIECGLTAILIALDQNADYQNPNFQWFKQRKREFVYIDRIIVAKAARGRGLARSLYDDLVVRLKQTGHRRAVCEVNIQPANPASDAFHAAMGFLPIGEATIHNGAKVVRYLERIVD